MFSCPFVSIRGSNQYLDYIRVHSCPFVVPPLPPSSCFFVYFVFFVVQTLLGLRFCIFVSIRVHSWFKPVFGLRSCPFVSIRGSPSPPPRVFRGSNTTWTTFVYIRVHSCPFVVLPLPPPSCFSCFSCFSWFKHCLDYVFVHSCPFVSIRGSPSSPSFVFFRAFRAFRGLNTAWTTFFCIFVSIRVHSWFTLFPPLRVFFVYFVFFVVQTLLGLRFLHIRVHSCPFVVLPLPPLRVFRVFRAFRGLILPFPFSLFVHFLLFSKKST